MESFSNKGKRCLYRSPDSYDIMCWRRHVKCTRVRLWYTFAFVFANMMSSAIASVHIMAANSIAPDLCEKMLRQFLRWLWTSFSSHSLRRKKFDGSSARKHSKWLGVCSCDYHDVTSLPTNSYVPAWLSVNHWCYQLLPQRWGAQVWCLWQLLVVTIAARDLHLLFLNRCVL